MAACANLSCCLWLSTPLRHTALPATRARVCVPSRKVVITRAEKEGGGDRDVDSLFQQELKRRGLSSIDDLAEPIEASSSSTGSSDAGQASGRRDPPPPPRFARSSSWNDKVPTEDQLERSRKLNSEGLEGLIPRATELLKLGTSFFLGFGPLIIGVSLASWLLYVVFGSAFIHGGSPDAKLPAYVDPEVLLSEPTADPMIPTTDFIL